MSTEIMRLNMGESPNIVGDGNAVLATISKDGDTFTLWWTDHVANEWQETHPTLSDAIHRLAGIQWCYESEWTEGLPPL